MHLHQSQYNILFLFGFAITFLFIAILFLDRYTREMQGVLFAITVSLVPVFGAPAINMCLCCDNRDDDLESRPLLH